MPVTLQLADEDAASILLNTLRNQSLAIALLRAVLTQGKAIMATEQQILDALSAATTQLGELNTILGKVSSESTTTLVELAKAKADLAALIAQAGGTSAAVDAALQALSDSIARASASAAAVDALVPDAPPAAPVTP